MTALSGITTQNGYLVFNGFGSPYRENMKQPTFNPVDGQKYSIFEVKNFGVTREGRIKTSKVSLFILQEYSLESAEKKLEASDAKSIFLKRTYPEEHLRHPNASIAASFVVYKMSRFYFDTDHFPKANAYAIILRCKENSTCYFSTPADKKAVIYYKGEIPLVKRIESAALMSPSSTPLGSIGLGLYSPTSNFSDTSQLSLLDAVPSITLSPISRPTSNPLSPTPLLVESPLEAVRKDDQKPIQRQRTVIHVGARETDATANRRRGGCGIA